MPVIRSRSSKSTVPSLSFLHWFSPHLAVPAGASWNSEMVLCVRFQNRVGRSAENAPVTVTKMSAAAINRAFCIAFLPGFTRRLAARARERKSPGWRAASGWPRLGKFMRINASAGSPWEHNKRYRHDRGRRVNNFIVLTPAPQSGAWLTDNEVLGMATRVLNTEYPADHVPLLRWLIFTGVSVFAFVMAWHFGLVRMMVNGDKTYISIIISVLYVLSSLHCLLRTAAVSSELDRAHRVLALVSKGVQQLKVEGADVVTPEGTRLPRGEVTAHIRNLILKASLQGEERLDQTLLLRGLADALRGPNQLGSYAGDTLMKLGLLGTIIGFIMMLAPIAGLDAADHASVRNSMGLMSDGMAVAMYTTLTGLIGSILVQTQYYMLDKATQRLFGLATNLTEVFVVSVLEQEPAASRHSSYALRATE